MFIRFVGLFRKSTKNSLLALSKKASLSHSHFGCKKTPPTFRAQCCFNDYKLLTVSIRGIHLSKEKKALPPLLIIILRPLAKLGAMIFGRLLRKWWAKLTPKEKKAVLDNIQSKQKQIAFVATFCVGLLLLFYLENIKEEPITKRKRFIFYNDEQMQVIAQLEYENQINNYKQHIVPINHPIYHRVAKVANRILLANRELPQIREKEWAITVIDMPEIINAFVLPHGKIFVFTGMLNICTNDDQLATVLSHEISHAVLSHMAESLSKTIVVEMILILPLVFFWMFFSDVGALFSQWLSNTLASLLIHLPFNRAIEKEADSVGMQLMARACFDVREALVMWEKMEKVGAAEIPLEWLSTHPTHESRQLELKEMLPMALDLRKFKNCPALLPKETISNNLVFEYLLKAPKS